MAIPIIRKGDNFMNNSDNMKRINKPSRPLRNNRSKNKDYQKSRRIRNNLIGVLFGLVSAITVSTIAFFAFMNNSGSTPFTPVFADDLVAWAGNDQTYTESVPGWLGTLPEDAPEIGSDITDISEAYISIDPEVPLPPIPHTDPNQEIFAVFPFYISENAQAYLDFHAENPDMDAETVVWKVNAFLHLPFYSYIRVNYDPHPLLVNPSHRLPYGFVPAVLIPIYEDNPNLLATPETIEAFRRMRTSINRANMDLAVVSAYRTAERQAVLFGRQSGDGVVARPYQSEHQTGRALDLWGPGPSGLLDAGGGPPSSEGRWIAENAHYYGFIIRYTEYNTHITSFISEPWHITYVTIEIAQYIHQNGILSLEEFVARNPGVRMNIGM